MSDANVSILVTLKDAATKGLKNIESNLDSMAVASTKFAVGLAAVSAAFGAVVLGGVTFEAQMETVRQGLVTLLGSTEAADKTIARIKAEAAKTPFEIAGLSQAVQLIASVTKDGDKATDIILDVGEALAAMGKGQAELDRIIVNLQQIAAVGKAGSLDIKQFAFAGIPIYEMLQKQTGLAGEELGLFIEEGRVSFDLLTKMFDEANNEGGQFFNAYINQTGTLTQLWSNFKDTVNVGLGTFVQQTGIFDSLKIALDKLTQALPLLFEKFTALILFFKENTAIIYIIAGAIAGALVPALIAAAVAMWSFISPLLIPMAIGAAIVAIFLAIQYAIEHFGEVVDFVKSLVSKAWEKLYEKTMTTFNSLAQFLNNIWDKIKTFTIESFTALWTAISYIFTVWLGSFVSLLEIFGIDWRTLWDSIKLIAITVWEALSSGITIMLNAIALIWNSVWTGIKTIAITVWDTILTNLSLAWESLKELFSLGSQMLSVAWEGMWNKLSATVTSVWDGIKAVITSSINWIIDKINSLISAANAMSQKVGGGTISKIPRLAKGGIIKQEGRVMVGERGPEMLDLPVGAKVTPLDKSSNSTVINLYISGNTVFDEDDVVDKLGDPIIKLLKQHFAVV